MSSAQDTVICGACHVAVDLSLDTPEYRQPCSACGSTARIFNVTITEALTVRDGLGFKHRRPGHRKPIAEGFKRPEASRKTGAAVERYMLVDRQNDRYFEVVTEYESGRELHRCDEKLSDHIGHGSAKQRKPNDG